MNHSWILVLFLLQASTCLPGMKFRKAKRVWAADDNGERHVPHGSHSDNGNEFESSGGFSDYFGGFSSGIIGVRQNDYGQFNSDTSGCSAIETKTCSNLLDCAGCLGLYSCNVALGKCQLKGLSRKSGGFYQSLKDA
ncbi:hypothetical protein R3I93_019535 [Phoxinus phoxinus]|uniref:Uncharacterized protein n=1 Tax=Phoxinus phoxinus TaxID=58324 RepID=A0AAN9GU32_9TELE